MKNNLFVFTFYSIIIFSTIAEENNNKNCDSYSDYIEKAKLEWPKYRLVKLSSTLRDAFVEGYNQNLKSNKKLIADEIVVFPIYDENDWYILAGNKGCFVFWINLEPDKFVELIDGGDLARDQGLWKD